MIFTVVPHFTLLTEAGFTDMAILTTSKGPGKRQTPVGSTFAETGALPLLVAVIDALTADVEVNWIATLLSVYVTVCVVCPALKVTFPGMDVLSMFHVYDTWPLPPGVIEI